MTDTTNHERQIAGWLLSHEAEIAWIQLQEARITVNHFTDSICRHIYQFSEIVKNKGRLLDAFAIQDIAKSEGAELDGAYCNRLIDEAITVPGHLTPSIEAVKDSSLRREAVLFFKQAFTEMQDAETASEKLNEIQTNLTQLQAEQINRSSQVHHITHFRQEKVEQWRKARNSGFVGLPSSISQIDKHLGGYRRKVMTIIGGYRGEGKSLFIRQELYSMARKNFKALLITLEDPEDMASAIIAGHASKRSVFHLDTGGASDTQISYVDESWGQMDGLPLWTASARTIEDIQTISVAHKARHGLDVIGIDHIQYIAPYTRPRMDRNGTVAMYSNAICGLLKDVDAAGLVASQFGRSAERDGRRPRLSDLRDSGTIEQDCRAALLLSRDADGHILELAKNNFGPSGVDIGLTRIGNEHRFEYRELQQQNGMV